MFKNYLITAFRSLKKNKVYSFLNILGLSIGMAVFILIFLYVRFELSFDRWHKHSDRIFRVVQQQFGNEYLGTDRFAVTPAPLADALMKDYPEIQAAARIDDMENVLVSYKQKNFLEDQVILADRNFFKVFSVELLAGKPDEVLSDPHSILFSESAAQKYFGSQNPLGETVRILEKHDMVVRGVFKDLPKNSHFFMDIMIPFETLSQFWNRNLATWGNNSYYTYFLIKEGANPSLLESKLSSLVGRYSQGKGWEDNRLYLQPLTKIHLFSHLNFELSPNNDIKYIYLFSSIGLLLLIIACINYVNLATASASKRAKEVGMRKVVGAQRHQLMGRFFGESTLLALTALVITFGVVTLTLPYFNRFVERDLTLDMFSNPGLLWGVIGAFLLVAFLAGIYPAVYISKFTPLHALQRQTARGKKASFFRNFLVVFQFTVSILLILSTVVVFNQLRFIKNKEMGYSREHIVVIPVRDLNLHKKIEPLKSELISHPGVIKASLSSSLPNHITSQTVANWPGKPKELNVPIYVCEADYDFVDVFELQIVQGRNFSREYPGDANGVFLINESTFKATGWDSALGKEFCRWGGNEPAGRIVGVVKDFHMHSLHQEITPMYIYLEPQRLDYISLKVRGDHVSKTLTSIKNTFQKFSPLYPFEYSFFDEVFDRAYRSEQKIAQLFSSFSALTVFIACLGLFGLASYTTERRTKEIGIRKVLGASAANIINLMSWEYVKKVLMAAAIACPVGFYAMSQWLQNFAYRIKLDAFPFFLSCFLALLIALFTVSYQTLRAAATNPAETIRYQ